METEPIERIIKASLITYKNRDGYQILVFENKEEVIDELDKYIWVVIPPNWKEITIKLNETIMLNYIIAKAGQTYYNPTTNTTVSYKTTMNWYKDSIPLDHVVDKYLILG